MPPILLGLIPQLFQMLGSAFGIDMTSEESRLKMADLELRAQQLISDQLKAQSDVNAIEAASEDPFVSRWRPFIGWVCGIAFAYHFILLPLLMFICAMKGIKIVLPQFDLATLMPVLLGMLGLGAMRSFDKVTLKSKYPTQ